MTKLKLNVKKPNFDYPEGTDGAKLARELRKRASQMSDKERADLLARALERVNGSRNKAPAGTGH
jgi:hypothetical protein